MLRHPITVRHLKGLVLDTIKGNILKLGVDGIILRASHGTQQLTRKEITDYYGEEQIWPKFSNLKENPIQHSNIFRVFENYFDLPVMVICARIVDTIDKKFGKPKEYSFWPDIISSLRIIFNPSSFKIDKQEQYFYNLKRDISKFVKPSTQKIINWIKSMKETQQTVFLLTNSDIDYTNLLMNYAVGEHWPEMFDMVVCAAGKPGFFKSEEPLVKFHELDGEKEVCPVQELQENKMYSKGNHKDLTIFLQKQTNQDKPKVLYFGDSIRSDMYPSVVFGDWNVVTVLEEMESEGMVICQDQENFLEDGPNSKKARLSVHDLEIESCKEEVLLSNQWGSFFVHADTCQDKVIDCKADRDHGLEKKCGRKEMNTFCGNLIQKYSTFVIPRLDFITELPLDYTFEAFSPSKGGFYPGSPKSLHS
ncbi:5'-nucleotidase domain-containing protein 1 [Stylophora pistillata]|uniref:5'-nucleotidase domain-containing protein 1 n=1 Tax=Stylophora pistillata TaxID=50429 RepID=A0A2B4SLQ8_STYPI|nr:5'-nucleotidase domain-containing protein 1 [Stylophora pistillata]